MVPELIRKIELRLVVPVLLVLLCAVLSACNAANQQAPSASAGPGSAAVAAGGSGGQPLGTPASYPGSVFKGSIPGSTLTGADYRISPLDVLDISVFQVPDLSKTVQVSAQGQISLALIGNVTAGGRTTAELEQEIATKLGENYLQSPQVSVFVKEYTSQRITVDGAVNKPGIYAMTGQTTLIQAIALASGLDRVADPHGVVVFRQSEGKRTAGVFDLTAIRTGKKEDPPIYGGDIIVVDQSGIKAALRGVRESVGVIGLFSPIL
jgi:polysaccharide export outer membrane protein